MRFLVLMFIAVPILEMWLLIEVGGQIGALNTIFLVFLTAAGGLALLRQQGLSTLLRVNERMQEGQLPAEEILEGVALAVGGALLLTPGFITDAIGFMCLLPLTRKWLVAGLLRRGITIATAQQGGLGAGSHKFQRPAGQPRWDLSSAGDKSDVIDGEYKRED